MIPTVRRSFCHVLLVYVVSIVAYQDYQIMHKKQKLHTD